MASGLFNWLLLGNLFLLAYDKTWKASEIFYTSHRYHRSCLCSAVLQVMAFSQPGYEYHQSYSFVSLPATNKFFPRLVHFFFGMAFVFLKAHLQTLTNFSFTLTFTPCCPLQTQSLSVLIWHVISIASSLKTPLLLLKSSNKLYLRLEDENYKIPIF